MTLEEHLPWWKEIAAAFGTALTAGLIAWRARGRRELTTPYTADHDSQPRVITRKEWHDVVQVVNAWPGMSARVKRAEGRVSVLEEEFSGHLKSTALAMSAFARLEANFDAHVTRWEEVGVEAREHRHRLEAHILRIEEQANRRGDR